LLDNLTAQCQEMIRPHAVRVGQTAEAYAQRIVARLDAIVSELQDEGPERFATDTASALADPSGIADVIFDTRPGQDLELLSITGSGIVAGAGTGCAVYHTDPTNELNLLHVAPYALRFSSAFPPGEYVKGARIVVRFIGQTPGQLCTARLKLKQSAPLRARRNVGGTQEPRSPRDEPQLTQRHTTPPQFTQLNAR
jgi:hypothetical protein